LWHFTRAIGPVLVVLTALGCGTTGPYVWARDLKSEEVGSVDYVIVVGDVISVKVFNQDAMSTHAKVRSDGKISMPFLGDITVLGKTPASVAKEVETGLKGFINAPNVTVIVEEFQPTTVTVVGEVAHPGPIAMDRNAGVLQALASAGGLTDNASRDDIYVLREVPVARRIRFTYDSLVQFPPARTFRLRPGDIIVVE
jgi:polysaccharide export outer membrane protein